MSVRLDSADCTASGVGEDTLVMLFKRLCAPLTAVKIQTVLRFEMVIRQGIPIAKWRMVITNPGT